MTASRPFAAPFPTPPGQIALDTPEGARLLTDSAHHMRFLRMVRAFTPQKNTGFCGIASAVLVLNDLGVQAPDDPPLAPYNMITQENIFCFLTGTSLEDPTHVARMGLSLQALSDILVCAGTDAQSYSACRLNLNTFRDLARAHLDQPDTHIIVNYARDTLAQDGTSHFSPLAAYHAPTDRFLILDVAPFKYPALWIETSALWRALNTRCTTGGPRGLLVVRRMKPSRQDRLFRLDSPLTS